MKSTRILNTAQTIDSYKDTNNLRNTLTTKAIIAEESTAALMVSKSIYRLFPQLLNSVVRITEGICEPLYKLIALKTEIVTALFVMRYKA